MLKSARAKRVLREVLTLSIIVVGVLAARSTLADHYFVPSGSMEHTLYAGDRVFVDKRAYGLRVPFTQINITDGDDVGRGEIVIFDSPRDGIRLIKRIVAVGGDNIAIVDGRIAINGVSIAAAGAATVEDFGERHANLNLAHGGGPDFTADVPQGMLLAVGDHRGNSLDGRVFGLISEEIVYGRAVAIYYRRDDGFGWGGL